MNKPAIVIACFICLFSYCTTDNQGTTENENPFTTLTTDGAWCWFSDPRAVYYEGLHKRTYTGWVDEEGSIWVGFYDHETDSSSRYRLEHRFEKDDHDNPALHVDKEGKLLVFFSKHGEKDPMLLAKTRVAEDISSWEMTEELVLNDTLTYQGLKDSYTYANIIRLSDEDQLYLFWRGMDYKPNFSTSSDDGKTWATGKILVLPERIYQNRRPYLKVASNQKNVIHFAFTDGHPNAEPENSIYYVKYKEGGLFKADGSKIMEWSELPLQPRQGDVVYDAAATKEKAWIWDVAENKEQVPVITYVKFPTDSNHVYCYALWDEGKWKNYDLIDSGPWFPKMPADSIIREPNYSGGIVLDHHDPSKVYLSVKRGEVYELEKWTTPDKGVSWEVEALTSSSERDNVRPFVVRDYPGEEAPVLWLELERYTHYTDYKASVRMSLPKK